MPMIGTWTLDPVEVAIEGWRCGWDADRLAGCFNDMPLVIARCIAASRTPDQVRAMMGGDREMLVAAALAGDEPLSDILALLNLVGEGRL